jgi:hypothetical protein
LNSQLYMALHSPPIGPIADESSLRLLAQSESQRILEETVDCIAERLVSQSSPLPENCSAAMRARTAELEALQREVWFCHWGVVVSLCVYQQLISHVEIGVREGISQALGAFLAESGRVDNTQLYCLIESEFRKHGIALKPDIDHITRELACTALHSTIVCYIRDIALNIHSARQRGAGSTVDAMFPCPHVCIGRNFMLRFTGVSSALLDMLYELKEGASVPAVP